MQLYLIRHAQSQNNALPESERLPDPGLTDLGREQASLLAKRLPTWQLTRLITSPFLRTLETTERIRTHLAIMPEVRVQLHEQGGCYGGHLPNDRIGQPGMTREEIKVRFPEFVVEPNELDGQGWWKRQPYESWQQAKTRAGKLLRRTCEEFGHTNECIAYVMHADIKLLLIEHFHTETLEMPANTSVTKVEVRPDGMRLIDFNLIDHLPRRFVSY